MTKKLCSCNKKHSGAMKIRVKSAKVKIPDKRFVISLDRKMGKAVRKAINTQLQQGHPVARYDLALKKPFFEYPDGSKKYE